MNSKIIAFAIEAHQNVNQLYDGKPYSVHLAMVAYYCQKYLHVLPENIGVNNWHDDVKSACWLHDTIEDCRLSYNDVLKVSNEYVADIVYAITNEKGKNRKERANEKYYEGIRNTPGAIFVKLCDRMANVKYSFDVKSRMFMQYQKENDNFLDSLIQTDEDRETYKPMLAYLTSMLSLQAGNNLADKNEQP